MQETLTNQEMLLLAPSSVFPFGIPSSKRFPRPLPKTTPHQTAPPSYLQDVTRTMNKPPPPPLPTPPPAFIHLDLPPNHPLHTTKPPLSATCRTKSGSLPPPSVTTTKSLLPSTCRT